MGFSYPEPSYRDAILSEKAAYAPVDLPTPFVHLGPGRTFSQGTTLAKDPDDATRLTNLLRLIFQSAYDIAAVISSAS
jgi:hypothetical protein